MLRRLLALVTLSTMLPLGAAGQPLPQPASGRIERLAMFASRHVPPRHVDVWLPEGYDPARRYAVLYFHDGQMLFDARQTWNGQAWQADAAVARLVREARLPEAIVVGVWNRPDARYAEYFPQRALAGLPPALRDEYVSKGQGGRPLADAYLRFLVEELKPEIDRRYATRPGPEHTVVIGSSMGGLISLYALCEYPGVFGGAAALSAHWVGLPTAWGPERLRNGTVPLALLDYLAAHLPPPGRHRIWIDRGNDMLDGLYAPALALAGELLRDRRFGPADATVRVYEGTGHNERDWAARLHEPLAWLFAPR